MTINFTSFLLNVINILIMPDINFLLYKELKLLSEIILNLNYFMIMDKTQEALSSILQQFNDPTLEPEPAPAQYQTSNISDNFIKSPPRTIDLRVPGTMRRNNLKRQAANHITSMSADKISNLSTLKSLIMKRDKPDKPEFSDFANYERHDDSRFGGYFLDWDEVPNKCPKNPERRSIIESELLLNFKPAHLLKITGLPYLVGHNFLESFFASLHLHPTKVLIELGRGHRIVSLYKFFIFLLE